LNDKKKEAKENTPAFRGIAKGSLLS